MVVSAECQLHWRQPVAKHPLGEKDFSVIGRSPDICYNFAISADCRHGVGRVIVCESDRLLPRAIVKLQKHYLIIPAIITRIYYCCAVPAYCGGLVRKNIFGKLHGGEPTSIISAAGMKNKNTKDSNTCRYSARRVSVHKNVSQNY